VTDWFYPYPTLYPGILLKRYKRFLADVEMLSGEVVTAHCPNTGPMTGVCTPGSPVQLSLSNNPQRKLPYTLELIQVNDNQEPTWVGVNTALPNKVVKSALGEYLFPELGNYGQVKSEVVYGENRKSRVDFCLYPCEDKTRQEETRRGEDAKTHRHLFDEGGEPLGLNAPDTGLGTQSAPRPVCPVSPRHSVNSTLDNRNIYLEVKNTTYCNGKLALFPDTETTRGQKHLRELMALLPTSRAVMFYFINRGDCTEFAPGDSTDPLYGQLLREAIALGLEVLPCRFQVSPMGIRYLGLAPLKL